MTRSQIALDTSIAVAILRGESIVKEWLNTVLNPCLPIPVVAELQFGALRSRNPQDSLLSVHILVQQCEVLPCTIETAEQYAIVANRLRLKGTPIPQNDIWIASVCLQHQILLATADNHFTLVEDLMIVNPFSR